MNMSPSPVVLVLNDRPLPLARRIASVIAAEEIRGRRGRSTLADRTFEETTEELRSLFEAGRPIVAFCAAGIVMRALAPVLEGKRSFLAASGAPSIAAQAVRDETPGTTSTGCCSASRPKRYMKEP